MVTGPSPRPSWADELLDLAAQEATGRLVVSSSDGDEGWIEFRDGELVGASAASRRPLLARRLTAFGVMSTADVAALLSALRSQSGRRLIDVLVQDRLVPPAFIAGFVRNTMAEQLGVMAAFSASRHRFQSGPVHQSVPPQRVDEVLATALAVSHTFPDDLRDNALRQAGNPGDSLPPIFRSVLASCDGSRSAADVADSCGLTVAETLQVLTDLRNRALVELVARSVAEPWQVPLHGPADAERLAAQPPPVAAVPPTAPPTPAAPPMGVAAAANPVAPPTPPVEPPTVVTPLAPEPVEPEPVAAAESPESRRAALNALADLTDAVAGGAPVPHVPAVDEPQSEVTTTSPRVWGNRPMRPANPMESGDVLRELKSLGD